MSLQTLSSRIQYAGGNSLQRINKTKLLSLEAALKNDYQSRMIKVDDGAAFRCLINNNQSGLKSDYDKKYISIPFDSGLDAGDTFECLDDNTHWMIYLPILTETAYLRSEIIRCRYTLNIANKDYWVYFQGATETDLRWYIKSGTNYNELNMSGTIYIKNTPETRDFFHRFTHIKIDGHIWEVQITDSISVPGILELEVQEYYDNSFAELPVVTKVDCKSQIIGEQVVKHDNEYGYQIPEKYYHEGWEWSVQGNNRVHIIETYRDGRTCKVKVEDGAIKGFDVLYGTKYEGYKLPVRIDIEEPLIKGLQEIYPYDEIKYSTDIEGIFWSESKLVEVQNIDDTHCIVKVLTGKKGSFTLYFRSKDDEIEYQLPIKIKSF